MNEKNIEKESMTKFPSPPKLEDYGLVDADLKRWTIRDFLLSEELSSVLMVLGTVLAIWAVGWWGIAVALFGLALLYGTRRMIEINLFSQLDKTRQIYKLAAENHDLARNEYEANLETFNNDTAEDSMRSK